MVRKVFTSQAGVDSYLEELGFTKSDGKFYWTADTTGASYLSVVYDQSATYTASSGTDYILSQYANAGYCIIETVELKSGGIGIRFAFTNDSSAVIGSSLQLAIVAKEDESGYVYFCISNSGPVYDNLGGYTSFPARWTTSNIGSTDNIAIIAKAYDNVSNFIDAKVAIALALQNISAATIFTFNCGGKKYVSGLSGATNIASKLGQFVFEID